MGKVTHVTAIATDDLKYALKVCQMYGLYDDANEIKEEIARRNGLEAAKETIAKQAEAEATDEELAESIQAQVDAVDHLYEMAYRCKSYDDAVEIGWALGDCPAYAAVEIEQYLLSKLPELFRKDVEHYGED